MALGILQYPDFETRLRRRAEALPGSGFGTPTIRKLGEMMHYSLAEAEDAYVLASTQVDFPTAMRIISLKTPKGISLMCNPVVRDYGGEGSEVELCASFLCVPERMHGVGRVVVEYRKLDGKVKQLEVQGQGARAVYAGVASLDGRLLVDRMGEDQRAAFLQRVRAQRTTGQA